MGQYYKIVNVDKKEYIQAQMVKLMEFSWQRNPTALMLAKLLKKDWKGDRIVVTGDYSEFYPEGIKEEMREFIKENPEVMKDYSEGTEKIDLYFYAQKAYKEIKFNEANLRKSKKEKRLPWECTREDVDKTYSHAKLEGFAITFDDKEYIDIEGYYEKEARRRGNSSWLECFYTILLASNDSLGGGDYRGVNEADVVGKYVGSRVAVIPLTSKKLKDMEDVTDKYIVDEEYTPRLTFKTDLRGLNLAVLSSISGMTKMSFLNGSQKDSLVNLLAEDSIPADYVQVYNTLQGKVHNANLMPDDFSRDFVLFNEGTLNLRVCPEKNLMNLHKLIYGYQEEDMGFILFQLNALQEYLKGIRNDSLESNECLNEIMTQTL